MKVAAITMVYNEPIFLPIWLNYYGSKLEYENLFIIDDGSTDGCVNDRRIVNLIKKKKGKFDEEDRARDVSSLQQNLLKSYDVVIYSDVDEIIVPDPRTQLPLKQYLEKPVFDYLNAIGLHVLHNRAKEPDLDLGGFLFAQRSYVKFDLEYCKPLISKIPLKWGAGFHYAQYPPIYDFNMYLFHLRAMDYEISRQRSRTRNSVIFSNNALEKAHSAHFLMKEQEYLDLYFTTPRLHFWMAQSDFDFSYQLSEIGKGRVEKLIGRTTRLFTKAALGKIARVPERFKYCIDLSGDRESQISGSTCSTHIATMDEPISKCEF
jgi:Glycosyl transferase family 2